MKKVFFLKRVKFIKLISLLLYLLFIATPNVLAATYYIATNGDDNNPGTLAEPWETLNYAVRNTSAEDIVYCKGGTYTVTDPVTFVQNGVTFKNYNNEVPVFRYVGPAVTNGFHLKANNIIIDGLRLSWAFVGNYNVLAVGGNYNTVKNSHVYFEPNTASKYDCIKIFPGSENTIIDNCTIYGAPNQGIDTVGGDNIIIRNSIIFNCQNGIVLKGGSDNNLIENNELYGHKYGAIGLGGTTDLIWIDYEIGETTNSIVRHNTIHSSSGEGIFLWGAVGSKVYHNTIYSAGGIHLKVGGEPGGEISFFCQNTEISNNIFWRTGASGIFIVDSGNDTGLILKNNLYWRTTGSGEFKVNGTWYNYTEFKSLFSYDSGSLFQDSLFTDIESNDFSLSTDSPAIDAGIVIPDYEFSGSKPDIGALEKGSNDQIIEMSSPPPPPNVRIIE